MKNTGESDIWRSYLSKDKLTHSDITLFDNFQQAVKLNPKANFLGSIHEDDKGNMTVKHTSSDKKKITSNEICRAEFDDS